MPRTRSILPQTRRRVPVRAKEPTVFSALPLNARFRFASTPQRTLYRNVGPQLYDAPCQARPWRPAPQTLVPRQVAAWTFPPASCGVSWGPPARPRAPFPLPPRFSGC